jgi:hypothetical protein
MVSVHKKYTLESCKETASKYKTRHEWQKNDENSYQSAHRYGWLDECCVNMVSVHIKHTLESCKENASKYKTRGEWQKNDMKYYMSACRHGWLDECIPNKNKKQ